MAVEPIFESYGNKLIGVPNNEESGGSGGHVIENSSGTDMAQRANMQFVDAQLSDDSTNDRTKIEVIKRVTKAQLEALGENTDGIYETTDEEDEPWADVSEDYVEVEADGEKTYTTLLNELYALVDKSKLNNNSYIRQSSSYTVYKYASHNDSSIKFFYVGGSTSNYDINLLQLGTNQEDNLYIGYSTSTSSTAINNVSSNIVPNGRKITLYYGNKAAVVELNTDAQHCIMSDGETSVESNLNKLNYSPIINTGLSYTNCTYVDGGYSVIGNVVIINIRVKVTEDGHIGISNLPRPKTINNKSTVGVNVFRIQQDKASQLYAYMMLVNQTTAMITTKDVTLTANEEYSFSAMYVSDYAS